MPTLWAVHIADGVLALEWWAGGIVLAAMLTALGAWRIRDEEVPRVALLGAVFFIASSLLIRVGPSSVHLLLNGLLGVVLGRRACLAIPIGLLLQFLLLHHGGFYSLGVNTSVMALPALGAWLVFAVLRPLPLLQRAWFRSLIVALCGVLWILSLVYSVTLLVTNPVQTTFDSSTTKQVDTTPPLDTTEANRLTFHPLTLIAAALGAAWIAWAERRLENRPEFPLGLLLGELTVLATSGLNCVVLLYGGEGAWQTSALRTPALLLFVMHLPLSVVEGIIVGFTVAFLARVKPELLGGADPRTLISSALPNRQHHSCEQDVEC